MRQGKGQGAKGKGKAMQRGLGGLPHERLHQEGKSILSMGFNFYKCPTLNA
jgi:hypothetical protein